MSWREQYKTSWPAATDSQKAELSAFKRIKEGPVRVPSILPA